MLQFSFNVRPHLSILVIKFVASSLSVQTVWLKSREILRLNLLLNKRLGGFHLAKQKLIELTVLGLMSIVMIRQWLETKAILRAESQNWTEFFCVKWWEILTFKNIQDHAPLSVLEEVQGWSCWEEHQLIGGISNFQLEHFFILVLRCYRI